MAKKKNPGKGKADSGKTKAAKPKSKFVGDRLAAIIAIDDDDKFLDGLAQIDPRYDGIYFEQRHEPVALFGGLWALHFDVTLEGIWKFEGLAWTPKVPS